MVMAHVFQSLFGDSATLTPGPESELPGMPLGISGDRCTNLLYRLHNGLLATNHRLNPVIMVDFDWYQWSWWRFMSRKSCHCGNYCHCGISSSRTTQCQVCNQLNTTSWSGNASWTTALARLLPANQSSIGMICARTRWLRWRQGYILQCNWPILDKWRAKNQSCATAGWTPSRRRRVVGLGKSNGSKDTRNSCVWIKLSVVGSVDMNSFQN